MSMRVHWADAPNVGVEVVPGGEQIGSESVDDDTMAIVLSTDEVMVIEGTRAELDRVAHAIAVAVHSLPDDGSI